MDFLQKLISDIEKEIPAGKLRILPSSNVPAPFGEWQTAGFNEAGELVQFNTKTGKIRVLSEWLEISKHK